MPTTTRRTGLGCCRPALWRAILCSALTIAFLAPVLAGEEEDERPDPKPQIGTRQEPGAPRIGREEMWPAPTAEDWAKPCLITWQRTWEDAVAISKETGKPILVCINMDGEIASEHYAGHRYRQPAVGELYKQYVTVIASVYRHTPRDYDDQGRRILCPRFGCVTCGEHIAIEPILYEKFLDGQRVAPRHIAVDLEGKEVYDVYYTDDTASVFDAVREGRTKLPPAKPIVVRGDRPIVERVASRDVRDRTAVEKAYRDGDADLRRKLLEAAQKNVDKAPLDLLRLAVFGLDVDNARSARRALAGLKTGAATTLISEALQAPMDAQEREALIAALKRLGESSALARWLAGVHKGLGGPAGAVDPSAWSKATAGSVYPAPEQDGHTLTTRAEKRAREASERPGDPEPRLQFAESTLELAFEVQRTYATNPAFGRRVARHLYADAERSAREAEKLGAKGWRVNTVIALATYYTGNVKDAYPRSAEAMKGLPAGEPSWRAMAVVTVFAESRWKAIKAAVRAKKDWDPAWLRDLHAAYSVLQKHPLGTDDQVVWHYEFLQWLGAYRRAGTVLREGIARFRASLALHERLRKRVLKFRGPRALEDTYEALLKEHDDPARLEPFAGLASIVAAEQLRRSQQYETAVAAYGRGIAHYEKAVAAEPGHKRGADHAVALAHAGRARVAYQLGDDETALQEILASFERGPASAGSRDAMGITPGETAQMLLARLRKAGKDAAAKQLEEALATLDQELLTPDRGLLGPDEK